MNLTKATLGQMLSDELSKSRDMDALSQWAYLLYLDNAAGLSEELGSVLLDLSRMNDSPEFAYTREQLAALADELMD